MKKATLIESLNKIRNHSGGELNEIDWEGDFSDVQKTCPNPKDVVDYLNSVRANAFKNYGERDKFPKSQPYIHAKSSFFIKDMEFVDVPEFIKRITTPPKNTVNTNDKILKTGGANEFVYKTGIPAFRGIAYDIQNQKFYYINTCPGAGACANFCYALKGEYIHYPASYDSMTRRLNYLLNFPDKYEEQMMKELRIKCREHQAYSGFRHKVIIRWNDSGDFFTKKYVQIAKNVIKRLTEEGYNIGDYMYTKVADVAADPEFKLARFSMGANKKQTDKVDLSKQGISDVVPKELFSDLNLNKIIDLNTLKKRVAEKYGIDINNVLTYGEMMQTPVASEKKYSVIVTPDDGDDAAMRPDVKAVLLTFH